MVGISVRAESYSASTVGWTSLPWSRRKIACRCGVTRNPRSRNRVVSSSAVLMTTQGYQQLLSFDKPWSELPPELLLELPHRSAGVLLTQLDQLRVAGV